MLRLLTPGLNGCGDTHQRAMIKASSVFITRPLLILRRPDTLSHFIRDRRPAKSLTFTLGPLGPTQ
jgi:hypothetical protein